jgi:hypothetical protein
MALAKALIQSAFISHAQAKAIPHEQRREDDSMGCFCAVLAVLTCYAAELSLMPFRILHALHI